jgi:S1-C subfamily serine protease
MPREGAATVDAISAMIVRAVERMAPYVVSVTAVDASRSRMSVGTGLALDRRHVLTHAPLVQPGDRLSVAFRDGQRFEAELVTADPLYFLAVLRLQGEVDLPTLPVAPREDLRAGVLVAALGDPFHPECSVTLGVVTAPDRTIYRPERFPVDGLILTDAVVHAANVGGPLITLEGQLIGVCGLPGIAGLNLAIQAGVVMRLVQQMLDYGRASHPWLGFSGQPEVVSPTMASLLQLPAQRGVAVSEVAKDGPGQRAGVRPFDVVVRVDDRPAESLGTIRQVLALHRPGETGRLLVLRGAELLELEIPVEEMPRLAETPWSQP